MSNTRQTIKTKIENLQWDINSNEITKLIKSCIKITAQNTDTPQSIGKSKFGGRPDLPKGQEWPKLEGLPLGFVAQINFTELENFRAFDSAFENKMVFFFVSFDPFFYSSEEHYHKYYPAVHKAIIVDLEEDFLGLSATPFPPDLEEVYRFKEAKLTFSESFSFPTYQHWAILQLNLSHNDEELLEEVDEIINGFRSVIGHQLFGYSFAIQGDTNYSWAKKYKVNQNNSRDATEIQKGFELLLQIEMEDKGADFYKQGDGGIYYGYSNKENIFIEGETQNT